ncbi:MAG: hypothetical protein KGI52_17910, partial [Burkholderiales bacterium]|nr:hypothetical protein [Burkholderiales bacterium]
MSASGGISVSGNVALLTGAVEIGSTTVAGAAFTDYHSSGNNIDYDARILASGGNTSVGNGALTYTAYGGHLFNGGVVMSNGLTVNNTADALVKSVGLGGYGGFWAEGSGTNNAYLFFANTTQGERFRITADAGRNLSFSADGGTTTHFSILSNGDCSPSGNLLTAQVNGNWAGTSNPLIVRTTPAGGTVANFGLLRQSLYGLDVGLDSDNAFKIGGWSQGTGVFRFTLDTAGNGVFTGNVTAYSDGRDKQDWKPLVGIKQHLLGLKNWGAYTDIRSGERKVGVVAQDFLRAIPEVVLTDESTGRYSFAYGQAAMAALVAYAHDNEADLNALR